MYACTQPDPVPRSGPKVALSHSLDDPIASAFVGDGLFVDLLTLAYRFAWNVQHYVAMITHCHTRGGYDKTYQLL